VPSHNYFLHLCIINTGNKKNHNEYNAALKYTEMRQVKTNPHSTETPTKHM